MSAVSRYHELHHLPSPTKTPFVRSLVHAYRRHIDMTHVGTRPVRIGCPASLMRQVVELGCSVADSVRMECCDMLVMAFVFQVRAVSMNHVQHKDVIFEDNGLTVSFLRSEGKSFRRPRFLRYWCATGWPDFNPLTMIRRWYHADASPYSSFSLTIADLCSQFWRYCGSPRRIISSTPGALALASGVQLW